MKSVFSLSLIIINRFKFSITLPAIYLLLIFSPVNSSEQKSFQNAYNIPANEKTELLYPKLVKQFYQIHGNKLFWFADGQNFFQLRQALISLIDSSENEGLIKSQFHYIEIRKYNNVEKSVSDSSSIRKMDEIFTDAAIALGKYLYQGNDFSALLMYDELTPKKEETDNTFLLNNLELSKTAVSICSFFKGLIPNDIFYHKLVQEWQNKYDSLSPFQKKELRTSMQLYRWVHHFKFEKYIVVNIPSATLRYYEGDVLQLKMKVVVGRPTTRTPRFAAHCNELVLYPYWNVPASIALNELLPMFKRNPGAVDNLNMQVLDSKGNIIDHHKLNWRNYSRNYFPFSIRQSTGCDNSLGVIKFNLTSPFSVYMHDTNYKNAFLSGQRFLSHGCIRLEKPMELANYLLPGKIDSTFLEACLKDQLPVTLPLDKPVPVFIIYQAVDENNTGKILFFKDVYRLLR